jgi:hypothetical protein
MDTVWDNGKHVMLLLANLMTTDSPNPHAEPEGQSPATRAWVDRRDAFRLAEDEVRKRAAENRSKESHYDEARRGNPVVFVLSISVVAILLLIFGWFFIDRMQCDPMFMDRGLSAACKQQP